MEPGIAGAAGARGAQEARCAVHSAAGEPRAVRWLVGVTLAGAFALVVVALVRGQPVPALGPLLALAVAAAVAVNRVALFPVELAITAEVTVLIAAVVGLHGSSPLVGPLLVALLTGVLDRAHWERRSFLRMGFNAASRAWAVAAAVLALACFGHEMVVGAFVAVLAFIAVDVLFTFVLLVALREPSSRSWVRTEVGLGGLGVGLGCIGAAIGAFAPDVGWWLAPVACAAVATVPELAISRLRRASRSGAAFALVALSGGLAVAAALHASSSELADLGLLLAAALTVGAASVADRQLPVPVLLGAMVVTASVVTDRSVLVSASTAAALTACAWLGGRELPWVAVVAAGGAAALAALVAAAAVVPLDASGAGVGLALVVALGSVTAASLGGRERRGALARVVVCAPALSAAIALGYVWANIGAAGLAVFLAGLALADLAATGGGSRRGGAGSRAGRRRTARRRGTSDRPSARWCSGPRPRSWGRCSRACSPPEPRRCRSSQWWRSPRRRWRWSRPEPASGGSARVAAGSSWARSRRSPSCLAGAPGLTGWGFVLVVTIALAPVVGIGAGLRSVGRAPVLGRDAARLRR